MFQSERYGEGGASREVIRPEMSFLSENPEAFGLVSDAYPVSTKHLLIAANGHGAEGGSESSIRDIEYHGIDELFEIYGDLLPRTSEMEDILTYGFGTGGTMREQPVARYCAVLAEASAFRVLNDLPEDVDYEKSLALLNDELSWSLHAFRQKIEEMEKVETIHDAAFSPTVGICRIRELGGGDYAADIFSAGDFRVYLLDERGMAPLWDTSTSAFSLETTNYLTGRSVRFHHPAPFAVLLVSESICALNAAEYRSVRKDGGLIWRYRMRLEDYLLRIMTDCVREYEFGERAARFFVGRSHGRDSASGALTVFREGVSYENFHLLCQNRLSALGRQMELLPNGYDEDRVPKQESRVEAERRYLQGLLERSADLKDRLTNALRVQILKKYRGGNNGETIPLPEDAPAYARLDPAVIREAVLRLDKENHEDRARISENHAILRESFAEHWVTLRPLMIPSHGEEEASAVRGYRRVNDEIYEICLDMNRRLAEMKAKRRERMEDIRNLMAGSLEIASAEGEDWVGGRAGWDSVSAWIKPLREDLPAAIARIEREWQQDTERYRSLLAAYAAQREDLFRRDILSGNGVFAARWEAVLEGRLPDEIWESWKARLPEDLHMNEFEEFLEALRRVSCGTGILMARIRARAVENRAARELANRADLRIAALRGAAYEDADWGEEILSVMDSSARGDFRGAVRRWQETCRRMEQQREAFRAYASMYEAYRT